MQIPSLGGEAPWNKLQPTPFLQWIFQSWKIPWTEEPGARMHVHAHTHTHPVSLSLSSVPKGSSLATSYLDKCCC